MTEWVGLWGYGRVLLAAEESYTILKQWGGVKRPKRKDNQTTPCISRMTTCSKYPATCPLPGTHSLFLQASRGSRHRSAITWESPYPIIVPLFHTLSLTLSFHVELLLSLSSCYLWNTDSSEEMTQNSDPLLPAAALPTMVLSFTHLANICWLLTRCPFHFVIFLTKNSEFKSIMKHFQNPNHSWLVDWLRTKTF